MSSCVRQSILLTILLTCLLPPAIAQEGVKAKNPVRHVVLISVDGLAASYRNDPRADMPTLRKLAAEGAAAEGMIASFPSVTWPCHVSLMTGVRPEKHGVIGNNVWSRKLGRPLAYIGDPELTKSESIRVPTLCDVAHAKKLTCSSIIWPCGNGAESVRWVIPDSNKPELHAKYTTPGLVAEMAKAGIDITPIEKWGWDKQHSAARDDLYTKTAKYLLEKHQVNLTLLHLITPDGVEHNYGPHTPEAYQAVAGSDRYIAEIWSVLQQPPFKDHSALFIVSDHGFAPYEKMIHPNTLFKQLGWIDVDDKNKPTQRRAWCVAQGGSAFVYLLDEKAKPEARTELLKQLRETEGVVDLLPPEKYAKMGISTPDENSEAPDFVLLTGPGYSFNDNLMDAVVTAAGRKGTHGHDPRPAYMHATFVAAGAGIKPGTKLDVIQNVDVAPTIAHLMGLELPNTDGRVLREILVE